MKKIIFIVLIFSLFSFCSCSNNIQTEQATTTNQVAEVIENNFDINNLSDETIKALSVIVRTNLKNGYNFSNNQSYLKPSERTIKLTKETDCEFLTDETSENKFISFASKEQKRKLWKREIKKSEILKFLRSKKISLSSLSKIEPETNEQGETKFLILGGKKLDFLIIQEYFNLESNKIANIESTSDSIIITGEITPENIDFDTSLSEQEAKSGLSYKELLKNQLKNWYF